MTGEPMFRHVLVGFDGSVGAQRALHWAAVAFSGSHIRLDVLMAVPRSRGGTHSERYREVDEAAEGIVEIAVSNIRRDHPGLAVAGTVRHGPPGEVLTRATQDAEMVVLGRRGHGEIMDALLGSVSMRVCAHAACPVVVVPPEWEEDPDADTVLVGVDDAGDLPAVDFAVAHASRIGGTVTALHAWELPASGFAPELAMPMVSDVRRVLVAEDRALEGVLAPVREHAEAVPIASSVVEGRPGPVLAEAAEGAALLVVGAHRSRGPFPLRLGPTVHSVLHHSRCPIALVPIDGH
jgi:nucleotide-binding universal stress UspA family protein